MTEQTPASPLPAPPARRPLRLVLTSVGIVLVLGGIIGGFLLVRASKTGPAATVAKRYLEALRDADYGATYDLVCVKERGSKRRADKERIQASLPAIIDIEVVEEKIQHYDGLDFADVTFRVTRKGKGSHETRLYLIKEEGQWRVCR